MKSTIDIPTIEEASNHYDSKTDKQKESTLDSNKSKEIDTDNVVSEVDTNSEPTTNTDTVLTLSYDLLKSEILAYIENHLTMDIMAKNTLKSDFELNDHTIEFILANPLEKEKIESEKGALLNYLRNKFGLSSLAISHKVNVAAGNSRPYTPKEKFDAMIAKNPSLKELRDRLGLDTDY